MSRALVLATILMASLASLAPAQNDVLTTLGTNLRAAQDSIFSTVATGIVALTGERSVFKTATPEQRAAMVRAVFALARTFTASPEFARRYSLYREAQKPQPSGTARTGDEAREQQQAAMELAIKQAMESARQLPPDARKELENNIDEMRKQIAELNADPDHRAQVDAIAADAARLEDAELKGKLAVFEAEFPADVTTLIARRLRHFLVTCNDVDYAARLETGPDKLQRFVNPAYERRSVEWKMCFRAGKPAVDAARAAANDWLQALDQHVFSEESVWITSPMTMMISSTTSTKPRT